MNINKNYRNTKIACYINNLSMSVVGSVSALLFVTFKDIYNLSYTKLGFLVLINFSTQLFIDIIFTFFSKKFNIPKTVKAMPIITFTGLVIYSVMPKLFPDIAFIWLCIGTVIFSVSAGLNEVLTSPVIAAIPSDNPEREMSKLHSIYAWGVVAVVIVSTLFLKLFENSSWTWLVLLLSVIPLLASFYFSRAVIPDTATDENTGRNKNKQFFALILCVLCIFSGGGAECTMTQWISAFSEKALNIPKVVGDVFGMALFALFLGAGRTLYAKYGKNIINVMTAGMLCAFICYLSAAFCSSPYLSLLFCVIIGFATSMLWPGTLILVGEKLPSVGVTAYALLAAGGDLGASTVPQLVGIISDKVAASEAAVTYALKFNITAEQFGIKTAIFVAGLFPLLGFILLCFMKKYFRKNNM